MCVLCLKVSTSKAKQKNSRCLQQTTDALVTLLMASCGEVDHSASSLASNRKGGGESRPDSGCPSTSLPVPECAICLQSCVHPVCLPCTHVFCFLCVKGASWQSKRCALCRQEIPEDFLERPTLLSPEELKASASGRGEGEHAWYYEGRNGWWQYDERTNRELEDAFTKGKKSTEMLIAGFLYVADLENMVQYRRNEHGRRRRMKRDVVDIPKKGVAGLRLDADAVSQAALRENSADGADTSGAQPAGPGAGTSPASVSSTPSSPPSQSSAQSPSLESAFAQLRVSPPTAEERGPAGEGEEADGEESLSPPGSSAQVTSVEESGSSGDEDGVEGDDPDEPRQPGPDPDGRPPHMGQSFSGAGGARRPDGQSTVTEV